MSIDNEIEAGRKHVAPVEHPAHVPPPQERRHNITPINRALEENVACLPQRVGQQSQVASQLNVHISLFFSSHKSVASTIWHEKSTDLSAHPWYRRSEKRRCITCSRTHSEKGEMESHCEHEEHTGEE